MNSIKIEFNSSMMTKRVETKSGTGSTRTRTMTKVDVKDPKCWEVITVENSILYMPGQRLTKKQVESLCRGNKYEVEIGLPDQFRLTNSRY